MKEFYAYFITHYAKYTLMKLFEGVDFGQKYEKI